MKLSTSEGRCFFALLLCFALPLAFPGSAAAGVEFDSDGAFVNVRWQTTLSAGAPQAADLKTFMGDTSAPRLRNQVVSSLWRDSPGVLDAGDSEVVSPSAAISAVTPDDYSPTTGRVKLTVNPGTPRATTYVFDAGNNASAGDAPTLQLGDHILLEVVVPLDEGTAFDSARPEHYPRLGGFPHTWMAFFSGEALFQCESSIQPGEWRPWLGYDSQVHGAALRRYPSGFDPKFSDWRYITSNRHSRDYVVFGWTAKLTRRMDAGKSGYVAIHDWPKKKREGLFFQRNNQKEGLNMAFFRAWQRSTRATADTPDFATYAGNRILADLESDDFLFLQTPVQMPKTHEHLEDVHYTDIITFYTDLFERASDGKLWKQVPADEAANPIDDIVAAYRKNRMWQVDHKDYRDFYGAHDVSANYEIQDNGASEASPNGDGTGNNAAPGRLRLTLPASAAGERTVDIAVNVTAPLQTDKGFYGNIEGAEYPAVWEEGPVYHISGLRRNEADNYAVSFIHEDSLGRRKYLNFFSSDESPATRNRITREGKWSVVVPRLLGHGYYSVNLWHKNALYADAWTRVGGKELLDIQLRFLSVPGSKAGGAVAGYPGVDLMESPGDGAHIYLEEFLDQKNAAEGFQIRKFHRFAKTHVRTYVFHRGDTVTFEAFDADPHTFVHRDAESRLSPRLQAKRLTEAQLNEHLRFYVDPIQDDGLVLEDNTVDGTGKRFVHQWNHLGEYQLKATYRGTSSVAHRIVVVDPQHRQNGIKADVYKRALTPREAGWLTLKRPLVEIDADSNWSVLSVENLDSQYRYIDGPKAYHEPTRDTLRRPDDDYTDSYIWKVRKSGGHLETYSLENYSHAPKGLWVILQGGYSDEHGWEPLQYVLQAPKNMDGRLNGTKRRSDASQFPRLKEREQTRLNQLLDNSPEPWQVRLPWLSNIGESSPHRHILKLFWSYRVRTDTKVIYDMKAFFDNEHGAFSGNPSGLGEDTYENQVRRGLHPRLMDDDTKLRRAFFHDLVTGRKIIVPDSITHAQVSNFGAPDIVIAELNQSR